MTEQETREKIFNIIREFNVKKRRYSTHTEPNDDDELADALIEAGIGDVKDVEAEANRYEMLYKLQNRDMALAERRAHDVEHRAKVAERALKCRAMCHVLKYFPNEISGLESCMQEVYEAWIYQAEKELAEEGKDVE